MGAADVRRAWHCDCDGRSHLDPVRRVSAAGATVGRIVAGMKRDIGEPTSCPWRAYGDPVVSAAMTLRRYVEAGVVQIDEQLAVVVEAMEACDAARSTIEAMDRRTERERREAEQRMNAQKR